MSRENISEALTQFIKPLPTETDRVPCVSMCPQPWAKVKFCDFLEKTSPIGRGHSDSERGLGLKLRRTQLIKVQSVLENQLQWAIG